MNMQTIVFDKEQIFEIAQNLKQLISTYRVITLSGPLGAGKTTLAKTLLAALGIQEVTTSPTFTYVNSYKTAEGKTIHHFDVYRINDGDHFCQLGFDEFLYDEESLVVLEWPEHIQEILPTRYCSVTLDYYDTDRRQLTLKIV